MTLQGSTVVDVAGGHGSLIAAVLRNNPKARGILFDLPHVVSGAGEHLAAGGDRRPVHVGWR